MILLMFVGVFSAVLTYLWRLWSLREKRQSELREKVARKRAERDESVKFAQKSAEKLEKSKFDQISVMSFEELRENLQNGSISCLEAVRTYYQKAILANKSTNSICMFIEESEKWAEDWDEKAREPGFVKPALFGVPFSLKECVPIKGYDQTRGFVQDTFRPTLVDSVLVEQLKLLGAIPFCQTNVPQSLLSFNCSNPVYGLTKHPLNPERTPGGSSGGESALLAANGSIIGIGGDVGGSIRIPCAFTGTAGIKPSHLRFSHRGVCGSVPGRPLINSNDGPMAKDIKTSIELLKILWNDTWISDQDPYVPPVVWNEKEFSKTTPLRIGYYIDDGWFTPTPMVQRAVLEAKEILEAKGHILVPFRVPNAPNVMFMFLRAVCVDAGSFLSRKLMNDIIDPLLYTQVILWMIPLRVQRLFAWLANVFFPRLGNVMRAMTLDTAQLRQTYADIEAYRSEFTQLMKDKNIDALLCPPTVTPALPHVMASKLFTATSYTGIFNLLDFAAGAVPVTRVCKEDLQKLEDEYEEHDLWYKIAKNGSRDSLGLPIAVQIATPPFKEEVCLRVLRDIEEDAKFQ